jgi:sec-independent protein translocase protein TatB
MFDVGFMELVLVSVIGLLVLGPQRLPKVAAEVGKWIGRARRTATQLRRQLEREIELSELQTPPMQPPPSPQASPGQPPADVVVPRSGDVPPGPGTHADQPDSSASSTIGQPQPPKSTDLPEPRSGAPEWGSPEHVEGSDNAKN